MSGKKIDPVDLIRDYAARGLSKAETMEALRWGRHRFNLMLDLLGDVQWVPRNKTINRRLYCESIRGTCAPYQASNAAKAREAMLANSHKTVRGVTGSIQDLIDHFRLPTSVSSVRRRTYEGMSLEDALFTPNKQKVFGQATRAVRN